MKPVGPCPPLSHAPNTSVPRRSNSDILFPFDGPGVGLEERVEGGGGREEEEGERGGAAEVGSGGAGELDFLESNINRRFLNERKREIEREKEKEC